MKFIGMMLKGPLALFVVLLPLCGLARAAEPPAAVTNAITTQPAQPTSRPIPAVQRVLIVSIDGARPDALLRADCPTLRHLLHEGAFSFWARTTEMGITLPSHVSMLTGVTPDRHGIRFNSDEGEATLNLYPKVPTLFALAKSAGHSTALVAGKSKFSTLAVPGTIDQAILPPRGQGLGDMQVAAAAAELLKTSPPNLLVVHLPGVDQAGHASGWGSPRQLQALAEADRALGLIVSALWEQNLLASTLLIVSADHGGAGRSHGPDDPRSRHIPWIAVGPEVRPGFDLTLLPQLIINTEDTFATACWAMGLALPDGIDGKPIVEILAERELLTPDSPAAPASAPSTTPAAPDYR